MTISLINHVNTEELTKLLLRLTYLGRIATDDSDNKSSLLNTPLCR